jgi:hypothetical protein
MYTVEDETFRQARAIISALASELVAQRESGSSHRVDLGDLIRSAALGVAPGNEPEYVRVIADKLEKAFPIAELFPRKRRAGSA